MADKKNPARTSKKVTKLSRSGRTSKKVKDPSQVKNRPRQGGTVPQTDSSMEG